MAKITPEEFLQIIRDVPAYKDAKGGKDAEGHVASSVAFCIISTRLALLNDPNIDPIPIFVTLEKERLTDPDERAEIVKKTRIIFDQVRAELKRRGVEIPERDELSWVARTSEYPTQTSFDDTGYKGRGD